jgi:hypothetical protein
MLRALTEIKVPEGISPVNTTFSSASLSGTDIALHNSKAHPGMSKNALGRKNTGKPELNEAWS